MQSIAKDHELYTIHKAINDQCKPVMELHGILNNYFQHGKHNYHTMNKVHEASLPTNEMNLDQ